MEPYGWDSEDEAGEEEFSKEEKEKKMEEYLKKKRIGISRSLQRDWYKKLGVQNMISSKTSNRIWNKRIENIPNNLLEDNQVFNQARVKSQLKKSLRNKYGIQSRGNLPSIQWGIRGQLRERNEDEALSLANRIDRIRDERERHSIMEANILDEELLRQSRLIDGRTPAEIMDLENVLRPLQNRDFATTDNIRRNTDRMRNIRENQVLQDRRDFELRDDFNGSDSDE